MNKVISSLLMINTLMFASHSFANVPTLPASWTGLYTDSQKISLFFQQSGQNLSGYSLLNGKATNFTGKIASQGQGKYKVVLNEQGQGNHVGVFNFSYTPAKKQMSGLWKSNNGVASSKNFSIKPQKCEYAKHAGDYPETSSQDLKDRELQDRQASVHELRYMRNEIYARHGYAFATKDMQAIFATYDWYMPCYTNVENRFTAIEKKNIVRLKALEKYAQNQGWTEWGR